MGVAERALFGIADAMTETTGRLGCLLLQGGVSFGPRASDVPMDLARRRKTLEINAKKEGNLTGDADASVLAQYISIVWDGLGVRAAAGVSREELRQIAGLALKAWPLGGHSTNTS